MPAVERTTQKTTNMSASTSTAIIPHDGRPTAAVRAVAGQLVSEGTKATYNQEHLTFMTYLYDTDADYPFWSTDGAG